MKERNYRLHLSLLRVTEQILVLHLTVDNPLKVWQCSGFNLRQGKNIILFVNVVCSPFSGCGFCINIVYTAPWRKIMM
jgi:hypothetical protein